MSSRLGFLVVLVILGLAGGFWWSTRVDRYGGDLAQERNGYQTKLIHKGPSPQEGEAQIKVRPKAREVIYQSGELKLKAWVSELPTDGKQHPALVYCHGGFGFGAEDWDQAEPFLGAGYILMVPMWRGENGNPGNFEMFYGEVDDAIAAGKYLAAQKGVDPARLFIAGHSAGGTLAALVALLPSPFTAAAGFGATSNQASFLEAGSPWRAMAPFDPDDAAELRLRSPARFIKNLRIPLYLFAGSTDFYAQENLSNLDSIATGAGKTCRTTVVQGDHLSSVPASIGQTLKMFKGE